MRFNCTSLCALFSDKDIERRFYCVHLRRAFEKKRKKKRKKKTSCPPFITRSHREYCQLPQPRHSPFFLPQLPTVSASPLAFFPTSGFTSFFLFYLSLSICLSVCLSVRHSPLHTLTHTISQPHKWESLPFTSFTHSLTHPLSLTHWLGFFFYSIHSDCTYVTTWTCRVGHLLQPLPFHVSLSRKARAEFDERKKKKEKKKKRTYSISVVSDLTNSFLFYKPYERKIERMISPCD